MAITEWKGPDVLVVGWIPFHLKPPFAPGFPPGFATTALFQAGNDDPPVTFAGYQGFADWLHPKNAKGTKEYRAAIYLEGVTSRFSDDGSPPRIDRRANGSFIGYTPLRLYLGGVNILATLPRAPQYKKGTGPVFSPTVARDPAGKWVELRYRAEFKLSWLTNLVGRVLTGQWAPFAWCEIQYRFEESGQVAVTVVGSAIPSARLYVGWTRPSSSPVSGTVPEYNMLTADQAAVAGFIQTQGKGCLPAPEKARLSWAGKAT